MKTFLIVCFYFSCIIFMGFIYGVITEIIDMIRYSKKFDFSDINIFAGDYSVKIKIAIFIILLGGLVYWGGINFFATTKIGGLFEKPEFVEDYNALIYNIKSEQSLAVVTIKKSDGRYNFIRIKSPYSNPEYAEAEGEYFPDNYKNTINLNIDCYNNQFYIDVHEPVSKSY